ncbi:hypothetical protein [Leptospira bouyouniensis]|uniref:hypothetical protein n=1 Tax=Leptospira bouyouniensis TaxID=2484911 RepID=UPI001090C881|nr:hypothetical protein [Leptospira bouyouniensis]TGM74778.1 hypothetical protein EHQ99_17540 [Leptospira bouyouniensis]
MNQYTATEALEILIQEYLEKRQILDQTTDYDNLMKVIRENFKNEKNNLGDPTLIKLAEDLFQITDNSFFIFEIIHWKLKYIVKGILFAIKNENAITLAGNIRILIEHVATLNLIIQEVTKFSKNIEGQQSERKIFESTEKIKNFINKVYYGTSDKSQSETSIKNFHINESLKLLQNKVTNIIELYDFLCEYVHPNYGSNILVSSGNLSTGKLNPPESYNREILDKLRRIASYGMIFIREISIEQSSIPIKLHELVKLCFIKGQKINKIFLNRYSNPIGDGKSKETAFYFPNAKSAFEAIKFTYDYFNQEGYEHISKSIHSMDENFIYDIHETNSGVIWVKTPKL